MRQLILLTVLVSSFSAHALDERARKLLSVKEWVAEFELSAQGNRTLTTKQSMQVKLSASGSARVVLKPVDVGPESGGFEGEGTGTFSFEYASEWRTAPTNFTTETIKGVGPATETFASIFIDANEGTVEVTCPRLAVKAESNQLYSSGGREQRRTEQLQPAITTDGLDMKLPVPSDMIIKGVLKKQVSGYSGRTLAPSYQPELECRFTIRPSNMAPPPKEIQVSVAGPKCICGVGDAVITASATESGGRFLPFEVKNISKKPPNVGTNESGVVVIKGPPADASGAEVVAVYEKDGKQYRSEPHRVSFCQVPPIVIHEDERWARGNKQDFVFDGQSPGKLQFEAESRAYLNGDDVSNKLKWIAAPAGLLAPTTAAGARQRFEAVGLPAKNDEFGPREIRAQFDQEGCSCQSEPKTVRLFFRLTAKNNPDGKDPNWFYYWKQTVAGRGYEFEYAPVVATSGHCAGLGFESPGGADEVGRYEFCSGRLYLADPIVKKTCMERVEGGKGTTGIDCFAETIRHETRHKEQLIDWWGPKMARYTKAEDPDLDMVPTHVEEDPKLGCDPMNWKSCRGRPMWLYDKVKDVELDAYFYGWKWKAGDADKEDWALPGKQWPDMAR